VRRQRRLGAAILVGIAAAVEIGLRLGLRLGRLGVALAIDQDHIERAFTGLAESFWQLEVDRESN
jgi:hypothetical protein